MESENGKQNDISTYLNMDLVELHDEVWLLSEDLKNNYSLLADIASCDTNRKLSEKRKDVVARAIIDRIKDADEEEKNIIKDMALIYFRKKAANHLIGKINEMSEEEQKFAIELLRSLKEDALPAIDAVFISGDEKKFWICKYLCILMGQEHCIRNLVGIVLGCNDTTEKGAEVVIDLLAEHFPKDCIPMIEGLMRKSDELSVRRGLEVFVRSKNKRYINMVIICLESKLEKHLVMHEVEIKDALFRTGKKFLPQIVSAVEDERYFFKETTKAHLIDVLVLLSEKYEKKVFNSMYHLLKRYDSVKRGEQFFIAVGERAIPFLKKKKAKERIPAASINKIIRSIKDEKKSGDLDIKEPKHKQITENVNRSPVVHTPTHNKLQTRFLK